MKGLDGVKEPAAITEISDGELLRRSAKQDEDAFLILYRRHQGAVFRFALHMSGSQETAEEVTQEVFLTLISGGWGYAADQGSLQGYLIGIARNKVRRQLSRSQKFSADYTAMEAELAAPSYGSNERELELAALQAAVLNLPPNYREVVVLCDLEEMDYAEVAQQLGCPLGTVRSRLHRARAILGSKMCRQMSGS
jgi:RNA polymerase sigma-70 factor (ECF subfamily)